MKINQMIEILTIMIDINKQTTGKIEYIEIKFSGRLFKYSEENMCIGVCIWKPIKDMWLTSGSIETVILVISWGRKEVYWKQKSV